MKKYYVELEDIGIYYVRVVQIFKNMWKFGENRQIVSILHNHMDTKLEKVTEMCSGTLKSAEIWLIKRGKTKRRGAG